VADSMVTTHPTTPFGVKRRKAGAGFTLDAEKAGRRVLLPVARRTRPPHS